MWLNEIRMRLQLLDKLRCPDCPGPSRLNLEVARGNSDVVIEGRLRCSQCGSVFTIESGIPNLLPTHLQRAASTEAQSEEIVQKRGQIEHFNTIGTTALEINRPHGCGRVYNFLLSTKFQIVSQLWGKPLEAYSILNVCCGSGMDTEFLARSGADVVGVDISMGALRGAQERARRYGVEYDLIVGDAENLPIQDKTFDLAFVHDGLHHLVSPESGFFEMVRTASKALLVTEPAKASATEIGVKLGLADSVEESGSKVYRFTEQELRSLCAQSQLKQPKLRRYAMYYRQKPLRIFRLFERAWTFPVFIFMYRLGNLMFGRMGNKIAMVVER